MAFGSLQGIIGRAGGNEVIGRGIIDIGVSSYRVRHDMRTISHAISAESKLWGQAFRLAAVGIGAVVAAGTATVVGAIATTEKFNTAMAKVASMTGVTTQQLALMRKGVLDLAGTVKQGPVELANALYFISSAGFRGAEGLKLLDQAAKASAASGADLEVTADALVSIMNAYGLSADQATYASDILTKTVVYGKVEFQDLAKAIGPVSTISRVAGVSLEDMGAALAMLTSRGLSARRATNTLWSTIRALTKPTEQQWKMIQALGMKDFKPEDIKTQGLIKVLERFDKAAQDWQAKKKGVKIKLTTVYDAKGNIDQAKSEKAFQKMNRGYFDMMSKMVGQSNAFLVSQILLQKTGETFSFYQQKMHDFTVSTNNAYETAKKLDFTIVFGEMTGAVQKSLIALGDKFMPTINQVVQWIGVEAPKAIDWFSKVLFNTLIPAAKEAGKSFMGLLGAIGNVLNFTGETNGKSPVETLLTNVVNLATWALKRIQNISDFLSGIFNDKTLQPIARIAAALMGVGLAMSFLRTVSNGVGSKLNSIFRIGTGGGLRAPSTTGASTLGASGAAASYSGAMGAALGKASAGLVGAADLLSIAGRSIISAAFALEQAALAIKIAASFGGGGGLINQMFGGGWFMNNGGRLQQNGAGGFGHNLPYGAIPVRSGELGMHGPAFVPPLATPGGMTPAMSAATSAAAGNILTNTARGLTNGLKSGLGAVRGLLSGGMALVSKAFLPLMVVDLVGNMAKEPLGDLLGSINIGGFNFKAAGEAMKQDFWSGVTAALGVLFSGGKVDYTAMLPDRIKIGKMDIARQAFNYVGVDTAKIAAATAATTAIQNGEINLTNLNTQEQGATNPYQMMLDSLKNGDAKSWEANKDTYLKTLQDALAAGTITQAELDAVYTSKDVIVGQGTQGANTQKQWTLQNNAALQALALKLANKTASDINDMKSQTMQYMLDQVGKSGSTQFNVGDLIGLSRPVLELLTRGAEQNADGSIAYFQDWATKNAIAQSKNLGLISANSKLFEAKSTPFEKLKAAFTMNIEPLKTMWTNYQDWQKTNTTTAGFQLAQQWIDAYGTTIQQGIASGGMTHPDALLAQFKKDSPALTKGWIAITDKNIKKYKGFKIGDIVKMDHGKAVSVSQGDIQAMADWWKTLMEAWPQAQSLTGLDQLAGMQTLLDKSVMQAVGEGMSLDQLKKIMPWQDWLLWLKTGPGLTDGLKQVTSSILGKVTKAMGVTAKDLPKKITTQFDGTKKAKTRTAILNSINAFLPDTLKFNVKGTEGWDAFKKMWNQPGGFETWLSGVIQNTIQGAMPEPPKTAPNVTVTKDGKKHVRGYTTSTTAQTSTTGSAVDMLDNAKKSFDEIVKAGGNVIGQIADSVKSDPKLTDAFTTVLNVIKTFFPQSPVAAGPLQDPFLPNAGMAMLSQVASGFAKSTTPLSLGMSSALATALGKGSIAWTVAYAAGSNLGDRITAGIIAAVGAKAWIQTLSDTLAALLPHGSPAKSGPFSSWAWQVPYKAGQNLTGQMVKGLNSKELKLPGLQAATTRGMRIAGQGNLPHQTINVDRMELTSQADEASILTRLQFLQPMGR